MTTLLQQSDDVADLLDRAVHELGCGHEEHETMDFINAHGVRTAKVAGKTPTDAKGGTMRRIRAGFRHLRTRSPGPAVTLAAVLGMVAYARLERGKEKSQVEAPSAISAEVETHKFSQHDLGDPSGPQRSSGLLLPSAKASASPTASSNVGQTQCAGLMIDTAEFRECHSPPRFESYPDCLEYVLGADASAEHSLGCVPGILELEMSGHIFNTLLVVEARPSVPDKDRCGDFDLVVQGRPKAIVSPK